MSDISKRISTLSPEKRRLLEILLREKGIKTPLSDIGRKQFTSNPVRLTPFPNSPLAGIKTQGSGHPIFFVHPSEGNIVCYLDLVRYVDTDHPFYGLQTPGLNGERKPFAKIEEMATYYLDAIKAVHNGGPYLLGGWSMGGIVAYEMAQQLKERGEDVSTLFVLDTTGAAYCEKFFKEEIEGFLRNIPDMNIPFDQIDISSDSYSDYMSDENIASILEEAKKSGFITTDVGLKQVQRYFKIFKYNTLAQLKYNQKDYPGKVVYFKAGELMNGHDPTIGWKGLASGGIDIHEVPGNHFSMMREPHVKELAKKLRDCLDSV